MAPLPFFGAVVVKNRVVIGGLLDPMVMAFLIDVPIDEARRFAHMLPPNQNPSAGVHL